MKISNLNAAYEIVSKNNEPIEFRALWDKVCEYQSIPEDERNDKITKFYTQLSMDGRFVALTNNTWDLKIKYPFEKSHLDFSDVFDEEDEEVSVDDEDNETDPLDDNQEESDEDKDNDESESDSNEEQDLYK